MCTISDLYSTLSGVSRLGVTATEQRSFNCFDQQMRFSRLRWLLWTKANVVKPSGLEWDLNFRDYWFVGHHFHCKHYLYVRKHDAMPKLVHSIPFHSTGFVCGYRAPKMRLFLFVDSFRCYFLFTPSLFRLCLSRSPRLGLIVSVPLYHTCVQAHNIHNNENHKIVHKHTRAQ